jgi:hypothetical protein
MEKSKTTSVQSKDFEEKVPNFLEKSFDPAPEGDVLCRRRNDFARKRRLKKSGHPLIV